MRGALAGGAGIIYGKDILDAVETKCLAKGDPYCEFLVKPRKEFLKTKNEEFKKQLGLK
jgi:predicted hydrocarbon binding protein